MLQIWGIPMRIFNVLYIKKHFFFRLTCIQCDIIYKWIRYLQLRQSMLGFIYNGQLSFRGIRARQVVISVAVLLVKIMEPNPYLRKKIYGSKKTMKIPERLVPRRRLGSNTTPAFYHFLVQNLLVNARGRKCVLLVCNIYSKFLNWLI